ncbi:MAG: methyltransferase domain-containing protein [Alphaproteobacteria bacterium]|nr:methyltransferase domain-containing protein [Alphaproteobacteria bacterium]
MDREQELGLVRRAYAREIMATAGVSDPRVETAFAEVRREDFLDPGPWLVIGWQSNWGDYVRTPSADPAFLYLDHVVGILPGRHLNNGQPSLHAKLIAEASPQAGEHVLHVGTGTGYYTAIMAHLVGPSGRVTGIELDPGLAERARDNLSSYPDVDVVCGNGAVVPFETADVIYVNAGATRPADAWLDGLSEGGRLILPLTSDKGFGENPENISIQRRGAVFRIERCRNEFLAKWISAVAIFPCEGARDAQSERALAAAFEKSGWDQVTRLYRHGDVPEEQCWLKGPDWCLAYA